MDLQVDILPAAREYIASVSEKDHGKIASAIQALKEGRFQEVYTKQLKAGIRELIVGKHRVSYFKIGSTLYFARGFTKKTTKTPKKEIEYAEQVFTIIKTMKKRKKIDKWPTSINDIKWITFEEFLAESMKRKGFREAYEKEQERRVLARQIRETRTKKHLTQQSIAKKAAMPQSVIARLESGDHGVSLDTLSRVAHALGKRVEIV